MYLTRHGNSFRFQRRIPSELVPILGKSPIRLNIGKVPARQAATICRLLVARLDRLFAHTLITGGKTMSKLQDPRDAIVADLRRQIDELMEETRKTAVITDKVMEQQERVHAAELETQTLRLTAKALERESGFRRDVNAVYSSYLDTQATVLETLNSAKKGIASSASDAVLPKLEALSIRIASLSEAVETVLDGGPVRPLMSIALDEWHTSVRLGQGIAQKKTDTDYNRIKDFIEFAGDRPVNKYRYFDFQKYANLLAKVPSNYNKIPEIRDKSRLEAALYNEALPINKRLPTLSVTSIETNYFSPLRTFFKNVGPNYDFRSPLADVEVIISKDAKEAVKRLPLEITSLNVLFATTALVDRADMKWMPLLGTIASMRVAEMVWLQGKDVYQVEGGSWVIDLTTDTIGDDGRPIKRAIKTKSSRRIIALPDVIKRTGFIQYAKTRRPHDFLFPACFYHGKEQVKDPAGAASKRLNAQLKEVGIHKPIEATFHSTRHSGKDIMRVAKIDERTHDKQTGHAAKNVSGSYGSPLLLREEIEVLSAIELPEGLDLTPYFIG
ncbi:hypothetical protein EPK99_20035 [Neorhizobium lilium]|uniref:DUF6538 domain-containing protein n=1 Tax=Neorhizobium lilium TaxID=2503024 RepID=A0A3S3TVS7_9HYPH|nr:DUF6538 domain-containing protein [Neorhizobium lilium]RWX75962.1 hypothetical protein EPK99_20035 [Neorhizobium lilium]